jgi:nicotinamide-nucleotide amidase
MKTAAIISVGTEIMRGKIDDTNSTFISRFLKDCGIQVKYRLSVEDEIDDIVSAINHVNKSDLIILTGGLGPTDDDLTREALASYLDKPLTFQESQWKLLSVFFRRFNRPIAESNKKQADLIEGANFIQNKNGTAPGMYYDGDKNLFVLLPGPPGENQPMIKEDIYNLLSKKGFFKGDIYTRVFRLYNIGESSVADIFKNFKDDIQLGYYFSSNGWVEVHFSKFIIDKKEMKNADMIVEKGLKLISDNNIFYTDDDDLSHIVLDILLKKNLTISFAESITGGNLSGELVKNPGSSKVFTGGIVSYSNEMKKSILGVTDDSLSKYGAVSEQVVKEMVYGLKNISGSEISISVSGIAGPDGGSFEKPVGLVYTGFLFGNELIIKKELFGGKRFQIINRCINFIYSEIIKFYSDK